MDLLKLSESSKIRILLLRLDYDCDAILKLRMRGLYSPGPLVLCNIAQVDEDRTCNPILSIVALRKVVYSGTKKIKAR